MLKDQNEKQQHQLPNSWRIDDDFFLLAFWFELIYENAHARAYNKLVVCGKEDLCS